MVNNVMNLWKSFWRPNNQDDKNRVKTLTELEVVRDKIIQQRKDYASVQDYDYSHVFRLKSYPELIRLSMVNMGIEIAFSAETAYAPPILLSMGIEHRYMTMVFAFSPLLGLFLSPILGTISDRCKSKYGRRRPMILILSIGAILGLLSILAAQTVSNLHKTEQQSNLQVWPIALMIVGVLSTEFNADNSQLPARAYMLDICLPQDHAKALSMFSLMAGVGGILGYTFGAINWESTIFSSMLGDNIQTLFCLVTLVYIATVIVTVTSFREIPLKLIEGDSMLQPITQATIKNEMKANIFTVSDEKTEKSDSESQQTEHISAMKYFKSLVFLPKELKVLCIANALAWMGHIVYCLFFTAFVGESVFGGDPQATKGSIEYERYYEGVRFGCWGRFIYALTCIFYSMAIERLMKLLTTRIVFVCSMLPFAIGMACLGYFPTKIGALLFSITAGIVNGTTHTIPFLLVAQYHEKGILRKGKSGALETRGIGMDCGIVGSMLFVGLFTMSLSVGPIVDVFGTTSAICYTAAFFSFLSSFAAFFVTYTDQISNDRRQI